MDVSDPLRGLAKTSIGVGVGNILLCIFILVGILMMEDQREAPSVFRLFIFICIIVVPALLMVVLGFVLLSGRLWAAIALTAVSFIEVLKQILIFGLLIGAVGGAGGWRLMILPAILLVRCAIAIPEIRFQLRARRRTYGPRGFEPVALHTPRSVPSVLPPRGLKPDARPRRDRPDPTQTSSCDPARSDPPSPDLET